MLGSNRLQQRTKNLDADIFRQERTKQFPWRLLINVIHWRSRKCRSASVSFSSISQAQSNSSASGGLDSALLLFDLHLFRLCYCLCADRSEEHTSELQSHSDLVCRLLLEKKN